MKSFVLVFMGITLFPPLSWAAPKSEPPEPEKIQARLEELATSIKTTRGGPAHLESINEYARLLAEPSTRSADVTIGKYNTLLEYAHTLEAKKAVLEGVAGFFHPYALVLLLPFLPQEPLRDTAFASSLTVARSIRAAYPEVVDAQLKEMLRIVTDAKKQKAIRKLMNPPVRAGDYILAWQVSGPHTGDTSDSPNADGWAWRVMPVDLSEHTPGYLDLDKVLGKTAGIAYLRTWVLSPIAQDAELVLKSKNGVKVWLNGTSIPAADSWPGWLSRKERMRMTLHQGENQLLITVPPAGGGWGVSARIHKADGKALENVSIYIK